MGIFNELLTNSNTIDITEDIDGIDAVVYKELTALKARLDSDVPTDFAIRDEVQSLEATGASAGTFTLTFTLDNGESFTTGNIAYNADAATIESAIDTAATGNVTGWTNGDISVANASTADLADTTFTFDGDSVSGQNHPEFTADGGGLTAGTITESTTTHGQPNRLGLGALIALGAITGTPPAFKVAPTTDQFTGSDLNQNQNRPSAALLKALVNEASYEEQVDYKPILFPKLRLI